MGWSSRGSRSHCLTTMRSTSWSYGFRRQVDPGHPHFVAGTAVAGAVAGATVVGADVVGAAIAASFFSLPCEGRGGSGRGVFRSTRTVSQPPPAVARSDEHTSELQSLMRISYAV